MYKKFNFSKRTDWPLGTNALMTQLDDLKSKGAGLIDLTESNPTRCGFEYPSNIFLKSLADPSNLSYDPSPRGSLKAREAISAYYHRKKFKVDPEQIFLTSSTSEGYSFLFRLLVNQGESVLFPKPSYPLFQYFVDLNDITLNYYPLILDKQKWRMDVLAWREELVQGARAVVVVNPNNPTGSFVQHHELDLLNNFSLHHQTAIISDEVFADFVFDEQYLSNSMVENKQALTFVLGGVSKALALPQMKLSWIIVNGPRRQMQEACDRLEVIADTYLSVNTPVQNALSGWLQSKDTIQDQIKKRLKTNLNHLIRSLDKEPILKLIEPQGGWYAILKFSEDLDEENFVTELLKKDHVFVHPGYFFDFDQEGYCVISLLPSPEIFQEGITKIVGAAATYNI